MPTSLRLQEEFGSRLQVLFVEARASDREMAAFALERRWLSGSAMWTTEAPFYHGSPYLPAAVLLSPEGEVLLRGNPLRLQREIERTIDEQVGRAAEPPADTPPALKKAWTEFHKGHVARAIQLATRLAERPTGSDKRELAAQAREAVGAFRRRTHARLERVEWMIENGFYIRAEETIEELSKAVKGDAELGERLEAVAAPLESEEMKRELQAARDLHEIETQLLLKGPDDRLVKRLERLARKYEGTQASIRAGFLAELAQG